MHDREAKFTGAVNSAAVIASETMILLNIKSSISQVRPRVERGVQPMADPIQADSLALARFRLHFDEDFARKKARIYSTKKTKHEN
jgi:hypothetical protein